MPGLQPLLLLRSPFGDDTQPIEDRTLHAVGLTLREEISQPFDAALVVVSSRRTIDPDDLVHKSVSLTIRRKPQEDRFLNGVVQRLEAVGMAQRDRWTYHLRVVPSLWFLSQTEDCRIFQQKTVIDIVRQIFSEHSVSPVEFRIYGHHPVREYVTQYNESDLIFVQRLLQESGCFYFFKHTKSTHTLIVTDRNQAFRPIANPVHRVVYEGDNLDILDRWSESLATAHGKVTLQDYDPTRPSSPVFGEQATTLATSGASQRDVFHWPAMTFENEVASEGARFHIEAAEAAAQLREGHGYDPAFCPGFRFTLAKDPFTEAQGIDYALQAVEHRATDDTWLGSGSVPHYENNFVTVMHSTKWRDRLTIPRPKMSGMFSGIVLGNEGQEIHADELGRIKVRLLFDRRKETVAGMAIWTRVLQPWSGNRWGWQHLPRVGTEVAVAFMNANPDDPVVVGCFYHQLMRPVFPIPAEQTKSGFRSRSTLHGSRSEFSELSFDDRKGQEMVLLHAQKDLTTEVEHDQMLRVQNDRDVRVSGNETVTVTGSHRLTTVEGGITIETLANTVSITSPTLIKLQVGPNSLTLSEAGLTVVAPLVNVTAEALFSVKAGIVNIMAAGVISLEAAAVVSVPPPDLPA